MENELIDQYLEGALAAEERTQFEQYFLKAPQRRDNLAFAAALHRAAQAHAAAEQPVTRPSLSPKRSAERHFFTPVYLKAAAIVIITLGVGLGAWLLMARKPDEEQGLADLRVAYKKQRLIEARITKLDHAPLVVTRGQEKPDIDEISLRRAELHLLKELDDHPDARTHHTLGRLYAAGRQFDKAIEQIGIALKQERNDARLHADLGAALLEQAKLLRDRGEGGKSLEKLAESLDYLNKALNLDPALLEARFNKALCLREMKLPEQAREAWQDYLKYDPDSPWAQEARQNLQTRAALKTAGEPSQVLEEYLDAYRRSDKESAWRVLSQSREMITGRMVPLQLTRRFLAAEAAGRKEEVIEVLRSLDYAGWLERDRAGDPFVAELSNYYAGSSHNQRLLLTQAQSALTSGYEQCINSKYEAALEYFLRARRLFDDAGDAWESRLTDYWIAYCHSQAEQIRESNAILSSLAEHCRKHGYKWLHAQALGWMANNYDLLNERSKSIQYDMQALELAEAVSDTHQTQKFLTHLATQYSHVGRAGHALNYHWKSLELGSANPSSLRQSWRNFAFTSETLYALRQHQAAAAFEQEALQLGLTRVKDPTLIHRSYTHLAAIYSELQSYQDAVNYAELSMQKARSLANGSSSGNRLIANSHRQFADILRRAGKCEVALQHYDQAVKMSDGQDNVLRKYDTHKGRLLCYMAGTDDPAIRNELGLVLELFEGNRANILEEQNRNSFFDNEQSVYDVATDYAFTKGDSRQAFEYAERSRARSLLDGLRDKGRFSEGHGEPDLIFSNVSHSMNLDEIQARLPDRVQIVLYSVLKDKLLIWLLTQTRFEVVEKKIRREEIEASVREYMRLLARKDETRREELQSMAVALYEQLLSPIAPRLSHDQPVSVIPDKALFHLPFSALVSPQTGKYLISEFSLLFAPSVSALILCSESAKRRVSSSPELLLSVGNPAFDRMVYPDLQDLPDAAVEAREIARLYGDVAPYIGAEAVKDTIKSQMGRADVLHFAGHYLADDASPMRSKLLLAVSRKGSGNDEDSALSSYEVLAQKLGRPKLVVLSACQTGLERYYDGEGMIGLSRTFLVAGVPLVVASQWLVDSAATAGLMVKFHQYRKEQGLPTIVALRRAQLDLLNSPDERLRQPYYWAAFLVVGGYAEF